MTSAQYIIFFKTKIQTIASYLGPFLTWSEMCQQIRTHKSSHEQTLWESTAVILAVNTILMLPLW